MKPHPIPSTALVATSHPQHPNGSFLFAQTGSFNPRPLTSFLHHKPICIYNVHPNAYASLRKPIDVVTHLHCAQFESNTGCPLGPRPGGLRRSLDQYRQSEACRCSSAVSDVAWFLQTHVKVADEAFTDSGSSRSTMLSLSSTLSSGPCMASLTLQYLYIVVQTAVASRAADVLAGATTPGVVLICFSFKCGSGQGCLLLELSPSLRSCLMFCCRLAVP
jgi:hypothetical protein